MSFEKIVHDVLEGFVIFVVFWFRKSQEKKGFSVCIFFDTAAIDWSVSVSLSPHEQCNNDSLNSD